MHEEENKITGVVECQGLVKIYKTTDSEVVALQGLDLKIEEGELMAIIGNSGSGKSTLLNMIGGLIKPSAGKLYVDGKDLYKLSKKEVIDYKRKTVGFVWQNNARNLIPYLSAIENIEMPMLISSKNRKDRDYALELLEMVGLKHKKDSKLHQLSGGEQQRIAIALALANKPKILLADEPTGSVDTKTCEHILEIFNDINQKLGTTIIIVTHDTNLSNKVDRVVSIRDGRTSSEFIRRTYVDELKDIENINASAYQDHDELIVVDKVGKMQLPKEFVDILKKNKSSKVKAELADNRIVLSPDIN